MPFSDNDFTNRVIDYLKVKHCTAYTGRFRYCAGTEDNPLLYSLQWLENNQDRPMDMMGEFNSEDDFFNYVCKEIDKKRFYLKQVFILKRTDAQGKT